MNIPVTRSLLPSRRFLACLSLAGLFGAFLGLQAWQGKRSERRASIQESLERGAAADERLGRDADRDPSFTRAYARVISMLCLAEAAESWTAQEPGIQVPAGVPERLIEAYQVALTRAGSVAEVQRLEALGERYHQALLALAPVEGPRLASPGSVVANTAG